MDIEDNEDLNDIQTNFINNILRNKSILRKIIDIVNERQDIEQDVSEIQYISLNTISRPIEEGRYKTRASCCPSFWNVADQYLSPYWFYKIKKKIFTIKSSNDRR